jgi:hypothetical protein
MYYPLLGKVLLEFDQYLVIHFFILSLAVSTSKGTRLRY